MAEDTQISVPPLKAHETRNLEWAKTRASTEQEKADFLAKADGFRKRIDAIEGRTPGVNEYRIGERRTKVGGGPRDRYDIDGTSADPVGTHKSDPYGPPGTGKTFETAEEAVRLCGKPVSEDRMELKHSYDMLVEAGQIAFVTFHQNYSYEDFVEGLRPTTGTEESDDRSGFRLTPRRGIFREISALAEQARKTAGLTGGFEIGDRQVFKMSLGRAGVEDHIFAVAITGNYIGLGWGGDIDWSDPRYDGDAGYNAIRDHWRKVDPEKKGSSSDISQLWPFRSLMREGDLVVVSWGNSHFRAIGQITGPYRYDLSGAGDYAHRRTVQWLLVPAEPLPVDTLYDKPFVQRSCYLLSNDHLKHEALARLLPGRPRRRMLRPTSSC